MFFVALITQKYVIFVEKVLSYQKILNPVKPVVYGFVKNAVLKENVINA